MEKLNSQSSILNPQKCIMRHYYTQWRERDNVIISLFEREHPTTQIGIVEIGVMKDGEHKGEALIWNLYVNPEHRGKGYGSMLLHEAVAICRAAQSHTAELEYDSRNSAQWVIEWYEREGFDVKEFGRYMSLMTMPLKGGEG